MPRRLLKKGLSLLLFTALVGAASLPATAAEGEDAPALAKSTMVYGSVTKMEGGSMLLENTSAGADALHSVVVHVSEQTRILDAVSGLPADWKDVRDGDMVYAHVSPAMALSEPPQATALIVLVNLPADFGAPAYYEVTAARVSEDGKSAVVSTDQGVTLKVDANCTLTPYLTKNAVGIGDLIPGTEILAWSNGLGRTAETPEKILIFPYAYLGYITVNQQTVAIGGEALQNAAVRKNAAGRAMIPLRAVCEAFGLSVQWDAVRTAAVVYEGEDVLFDHVIGTNTASVGGGGRVMLQNVTWETGGTTYIVPDDLARLIPIAVESK